MKQTHPSRTAAHEPYCTWTQEVFYIDAASQEIARVHQYLRPDGKLGASGLPDPKMLIENGTAYRLRPRPKNLCEAIAYTLSDRRDRLYWLLGLEVD